MDETDSAQLQPFLVIYLDHSGNRYHFSCSEVGQAGRFVYDPVTPEQSSSGLYSGGRPRQGGLTQEQALELLRRVQDLEASTHLHVAQRRMGTGSFTIRENDGVQRKFLLAAGTHRRDFETFLETFR